MVKPKDGKRRECPVDWTPLQPRTSARGRVEVTVDSCPKCNGTFLDQGELGRLTGNRDLNTLLTKHLGIDSDSPYVCPRCGGLMDAEQAGAVRVDVCLSCKGVWVDRGELEALQADTSTDFGTLSPAKQAELHDEQRAKARDRKAFWGRLFGRRS
ncbi:MAG: zf-TFIIB domain-containing protein [Thermoplasmatota archaeon]